MFLQQFTVGKLRLRNEIIYLNHLLQWQTQVCLILSMSQSNIHPDHLHLYPRTLSYIYKEEEMKNTKILYYLVLSFEPKIHCRN